MLVDNVEKFEFEWGFYALSASSVGEHTIV